MSPLNAMAYADGLADSRRVVRDLNGLTRDRFDALTDFYGLAAVAFPLLASDTADRLRVLACSDNTVHPWLVTNVAADAIRLAGFGDWLDDVLKGGGFRLVQGSEAVLFRARVVWSSVDIIKKTPVHFASLANGVSSYGVNLLLPLDPDNGWAGSEFMRVGRAEQYSAADFDLLRVSFNSVEVLPPVAPSNVSAVLACWNAGPGGVAEWLKLSRPDRLALVAGFAADNAEPAPVAPVASQHSEPVEPANIVAPVIPVASSLPALPDLVEWLAAVCPSNALPVVVAPVVPPLPPRPPVVHIDPVPVTPVAVPHALPWRCSRKTVKRLKLDPGTVLEWLALAPAAGFRVAFLGGGVVELVDGTLVLELDRRGSVVLRDDLAARYGAAPRRWLDNASEADALRVWLFGV